MILYTAAPTATATTEWWTTGAGGIVIGITLKWLVDLLTDSQRHRRENRLRYVAEKRAVYADFILARRELNSLSRSVRARKMKSVCTKQRTL